MYTSYLVNLYTGAIQKVETPERERELLALPGWITTNRETYEMIERAIECALRKED